MALQVGELFASFQLDTSGFVTAVAEIESELGALSATMTTVGTMMERILTGNVVGFAQESYEAGSAFSAEMSRVAAISGASAGDLEQMRQAAIDMGSTTSFTATEAAQALRYMAMAGWGTDQMLGGLGPVMDLAAASGADLAATSDIVTDAMTAMGISAADNWKTLDRYGRTVDTGVSNTQHFADVLNVWFTRAVLQNCFAFR